MSVRAFLIVILLIHSVHASTSPLPRCSLQTCVQLGAKARCTFMKKSGKGVKLTCKKWSKVDPDACPKIVCEVACVDLPKKGPYCKDGCPACRFPFESCRTNFRLFKPSKKACSALRTPSPSPSTSPTGTPPCSLSYCSRHGFRARCVLKRRGRTRVIRCGKWPKLARDVCPKIVCLILCSIPAKKGPVCTSCPDCAFVAPSCASNFRLYRAKKCPGRKAVDESA